MKKTVALLMAILCIVSLTACGNAETKARETAEGFLNAVVNLDFEGAKQYVDNEDAIPEAIENIDIGELMGSLPEELQEGYGDELKGLVTKITDRAKEKLSYEILGVTEGEGEYAYSVKLTLPDVDTNALADSIDEKTVTDLFTGALTSGKITLGSSQEEILAAVMPELITLLDQMIDTMEIGAEESEIEVVVTETDGKWLVNAEKSNIG